MNKAEAIANCDVRALTKVLRTQLQPDNIPKELKLAKAWLCWKTTEIDKKTGKVNKLPVYPSSGANRHGKQGSPADLEMLGTWAEAKHRFDTDKTIAGVGFATLPQFGITALDVDHCIDPKTGESNVDADVDEFIQNTYVEISPSGFGIRAFIVGTATSAKNNDEGFELFGTNGFVTVTGVSYFEDQPEALHVMDDALKERLEIKAKLRVKKNTETVHPISTSDPYLQRVITKGLFVRFINESTAAIECPLNHLHSDPNRSPGSGDATYLLPHHNGYPHGMFYCSHTHHEKGMEYQNEYLAAIGYDPFDGLGRMIAGQKLDSAAGEVVALSHNPTQDNLALICRNLYRGEILYAHQHGKWYEWNGTVWQEDSTNKVFNMVREVIRRGNREGKANMGSANFCHGTELFCRADPAFAIDGNGFDQDHYLLNTPAGTVDLHTGKIRQHSPDDLLTKITAVAPTSQGGVRFKQFLNEITGGDDELVWFLKVSLGACLSGAVESHWLLFWTGFGRNGKNTLGDAVMFAMGSYALQIATSALMDAKHEAHPTELAQLQGIRLAIASEVSQGSYWNESRINSLTGDTVISARFMRQDFFTFPRTHKHLIYGNHRPQLRNATDAVKARLKIVPFKQSFVGREDPLLPQTLKQEAGFILQWLIEGHSEWLRNDRKLPECQAVANEVETYFSDQSTVEVWVVDCCEQITSDNRLDNELTSASELYRSYQQWKQDMGETPLSMSKWGATMARMFVKVKYSTVRYRGVSLKIKTGGQFASLASLSNKVQL